MPALPIGFCFFGLAREKGSRHGSYPQEWMNCGQLCGPVKHRGIREYFWVDGEDVRTTPV